MLEQKCEKQKSQGFKFQVQDSDLKYFVLGDLKIESHFLIKSHL